MQAPRADRTRRRDGSLGRMLPMAGLLLASLALCACQTDGAGTASAGGQTLAFDSIDGPPKPTFEKLVGQLSSEADARRVAVVSRGETAAYRVKGYLALHMEKGKASVAYAWDIYDANKVRVARVIGEERASASSAKGWAACDDAIIAKIAGRSMAELAETLGVGGARGAAPAAAGESAPTTTPASSPAPAEPAAQPPAPSEGGAAVAEAAPVPAAPVTTASLAYTAD